MLSRAAEEELKVEIVDQNISECLKNGKACDDSSFIYFSASIPMENNDILNEDFEEHSEVKGVGQPYKLR